VKNTRGSPGARSQMKVHVRQLLGMLAVLCLGASCVSRYVAVRKPARPANGRIPFSKHPHFDMFCLHLKDVPLDHGRRRGANHFYVAPYSRTNDWTFMFWKEKRSLTLVEFMGSREEAWIFAVRYPRKVWKIDEPIRPTPTDIGESTFLVDQAWIGAKVRDCVVNGEVLTLGGWRR